MFAAASKSLERFVEDLLYSAVFAQVFKDFEDDLIAALNPDRNIDILDAYDNLMSEMDRLGKEYISALAAMQSHAAERGYDMWAKGLDGSTENTLRGSLAKASQESINLLAGFMGGQRVDISVIREKATEIVELLKASVDLSAHPLSYVLSDGFTDFQGVFYDTYREVAAIRELNQRLVENSEMMKGVQHAMLVINEKIEVNTNKSYSALNEMNVKGIKVNV